MAVSIRSPKNFWAGLLYCGVGTGAVLIARDYSWGRAGRMGPGYFPTILGALLLVVGLVALVRSLTVRGEAVGAIAWKGLALVTAATMLFGLLLRPAGLVVALVALVLVSAASSAKFRFEWKALGLMIALIAFCAVVFVHLLGLPMPLLGTWLAR